MSNSDVMQRKAEKTLTHREPFSTQSHGSREPELPARKRKQDERLSEYEAEDGHVALARF